MELSMTVHVPRRRPRPAEVVVSAAPGSTVADLRAALGTHLAMVVDALGAGGRVLADDEPLGLPPLLDGASIAVLGAGAGADGAPPPARPVLVLACVGGPDAGRSVPLGPPGVDVGRSPSSGLRLADPSLSRTHARVGVDADGVHVEDLGSTNGVVVDGVRALGRVPVDTASTIVIGASTLRLRRTAGPGMPVGHPGDGTVLVTPGRAVAPEPAPVRIEAPPPPAEPVPARLPWVAALVPVPVVVGMAFFLGPQLLPFALVGPLAVLGTALADRVAGRRRHRRALAEHEVARSAAAERFDAAVAAEQVLRHRAHPDPEAVLRRAEHRLPGLWSGPDGLTVRLGLGAVPTRATWSDGTSQTSGTARGVPVVVDLAQVPCVGFVGEGEPTRAAMAAVLGQLLVRHPPSRLGLRVARAEPAGPGADPWAWCSRVPHAAQATPGVVVVPDAAAAGALDQVAEAVAAGVPVLVGAATAADLPDTCGRVLTLAGGPDPATGGPGEDPPLVPDGVGPGWCDRLSRALAPLREAGPGSPALPRALGLTDVLADPLTAEGVRAAWSRACGPVAVVGVAAGAPFTIDLAADGPHVLVGGTTGSGKSEFLRSLVTGLALASPPEDLTLLLVDFKGGAAFGPCARLPHVVGVVTDLDDHLADRVLRSLEAEIRRREALLAAAGAGDLTDYRGRAGAEPLPRLVLVVDELRTLVDELPDLVHGLVRVAAQGRSLGIHLVLATQRPAGTVTADVQANVNLRIAFRVRDRADSIGVVEDDVAARLPADVPGRGVARGGDGRLTEFQVALVSPGQERAHPVLVRALDPDGAGDPGSAEAGDRAEQTATVVEVLARAHRDHGGAQPRRPWLPPLPTRLEPAAVGPTAVGLVDEPDLQRQTPMTWHPGTTLWRVVGQPRTGRTSAARALVAAACRSLGPDRLHVHAVTTGAGLEDLRALPHVGTLARADDAAAVRALLEHLSGTLARPGAPPSGPAPEHTLLVVDGWEQLVDGDDPRDPGPASEEVLRLVRDGAAAGLVGVVTGGRDLLRSRWSALGGQTLLLAPADPLDAAILGLPSSALPRTRSPGRAVRVSDAREVQILAPAALGPVPEPGRAARRPWTYRPLPDRLTRAELARAAPAQSPLLLGATGPTCAPWAWDPAGTGRRLLVAGPARSGRSTTLAALARSAVDAHLPVAVVADRDPARWAAGVPVVGAHDVDRLVDLRRSRPDLLVLVDDADTLDDAPVRPVLEEIAGLVDRDGGAVVAATSTSALRTRFRGLDVDLARHRSALLLRPEAGDGDLLGARRLPPQPAAPPGRGVLVVHGEVTAVQVLDEPGPGDVGGEPDRRLRPADPPASPSASPPAPRRPAAVR